MKYEIGQRVPIYEMIIDGERIPKGSVRPACGEYGAYGPNLAFFEHPYIGTAYMRSYENLFFKEHEFKQECKRIGTCVITSLKQQSPEY